MKTIYLLSGPGKNTGFPDKIKELLKIDLKNKKSIAFIPTSPDNFERNDLYVYGDKKEVKGIMEYLNEISSLEIVNIIDKRIDVENAKKILKEPDVLYLLGGNPFTQLKYIKENEFDEIIKDFKGLIIGTSAGAMNLAQKAYYSKDEDFEKSIFYNALDIVDITIDPHFDIMNEEQANEIKINSQNRKIIGLPNESGIRIKLDKVEYIGKCYKVVNKIMTEII